jgi:hypothetical protein
MQKINPIRRAMRVLNAFTLSTLNAPNPYASAYTSQGGRSFSGTRVF